MKKNILFLLLCSSLFANNITINKLNEQQKNNLNKVNYENYDTKMIVYYTQLDKADIYLKMIKNKVKEIDKN